MATHSSILAWRIPRTEGPGGLQSPGPPMAGLRLAWVRLTPQSLLRKRWPGRPSVPRQGSATSGPRLPSGSTLMGQELGPNPSRFFTFLLCDPGEPGPGSLVRRVSLWRRKDSPRPGPAPSLHKAFSAVQVP